MLKLSDLGAFTLFCAIMFLLYFISRGLYADGFFEQWKEKSIREKIDFLLHIKNLTNTIANFIVYIIFVLLIFLIDYCSIHYTNNSI